MNAAPIVVHEFQKSRFERVRLSLQQFEGRQVLDVRVWLPLADGTLVQGRKGLTLDPALLPELEHGIRAARAALNASPSAIDMPK